MLKITLRKSLSLWWESLPIVKKGMLLILLPLVFQSLSLAAFLALYSRAGDAQDWYVHSAKVVPKIDTFQATLSKAYNNAVLSLFLSRPDVEEESGVSFSRAEDEVAQLRAVLGDNPNQLARLLAVQQGFAQFRGLVEQLNKVVKMPSETNVDETKRAQTLRKLFDESLSAKNSLDGWVDEIKNEEVRLQSLRLIRLEDALRTNVVVVLVGFMFVALLSLYLLHVFQNAVVLRLRGIAENLLRVESGESLSPRLGGIDEIALVDNAVHALSSALAAKELETEVFLYSVSHDLRSPLVNLGGFTDELRLSAQELRAKIASSPPDLDDAKRIIDHDFERSFGFLKTSVTRLSKIIDALLRLSRVGRVQYQHEPVALGVVLQRVVDSLKNSISKAGASVTIAELPIVYGDETALEQIFSNLLTNAVTYLSPDRLGVIEVGVTDESKGSRFATIYVRDNGVGMSASATKRLFLAFQRFRPDLAPGEGIGLALARRVLDSLGGSIRCESVEGQGTAFFLSLPLDPDIQLKVRLPEAGMGI